MNSIYQEALDSGLDVGFLSKEGRERLTKDEHGTFGFFEKCPFENRVKFVTLWSVRALAWIQGSVD